MKQWVCQDCQRFFTTVNDAQPFPMTCELCRAEKHARAPQRPLTVGRALTPALAPATPTPVPVAQRPLPPPSARNLSAITTPARALSAVSAVNANRAQHTPTAVSPRSNPGSSATTPVPVAANARAAGARSPARLPRAVEYNAATNAAPQNAHADSAPANRAATNRTRRKLGWVLLGSLSACVLLVGVGYFALRSNHAGANSADLAGASVPTAPTLASGATAHLPATPPLTGAGARDTAHLSNPANPAGAAGAPSSPEPAPDANDVTKLIVVTAPGPLALPGIGPTERGEMLVRLNCGQMAENGGIWQGLNQVTDKTGDTMVWVATAKGTPWPTYVWLQPTDLGAVFYVRMRYRAAGLNKQDLQIDFRSETKSEQLLPLPAATDDTWVEMEGKVQGVPGPLQKFELRVAGEASPGMKIVVDWMEIYAAKSIGSEAIRPPSMPGPAVAGAEAPHSTQPEPPTPPAAPLAGSGQEAAVAAPAPAPTAQMLTDAIRKGDLATVKQLFTDAPTLFTVTPKTDHPIHTAAQYNRTEIVKYLLDAGTPMELLNSVGRTPLMLSLATGSKNETFKMLLDLGADVNTVDRYGQSSVFFAVLGNNLETMNLLIAHHAKLDLPNNANGRSPLFRAVESDRREIAAAMVKAGANPNFKDKGGKTPMSLAIDLKHPAMAMILNGQTPPAGMVNPPPPPPPLAKPKPGAPMIPVVPVPKPAAPATPGTPGLPANDDG